MTLGISWRRALLEIVRMDSPEVAGEKLVLQDATSKLWEKRLGGLGKGWI